MSRAVRQKAPIHRALWGGGRHYSENWQAWQTVKKANLVRLSKVSFFDPGVSRKSPVPWHFLGVLQPVRRAVWDGALCHLSSNAIVLPRGLVERSHTP